MKKIFKILMPSASLLILLLTGCRKEAEIGNKADVPPSGPHHVELVHFLLHIEDRNMQPPTNAKDPLWDNRGHTPIIARDGHHVTLAEFIRVTGSGEVAYTAQGTSITISLQDLIPNGLYSVWILTFKQPGFHGSYVNLIGNGALAINGTGANTFIASPDGAASLSGIMHAQSLSIFGSVGDCLCSEYDVQLMVAYHSKNLIPNNSPGSEDSWVTQFIFPFRGRR